jgi:dethiobiotin synthetase
VSLFITGTDTGVGKTQTAVQLLRLLGSAGIRRVGMKPICCGDRRDAQLLLAAGDDGFSIDEINPVWLKTLVAPFAASLVEQTTIDIERIVGAFFAIQRRVERVIVEGVGGWLVPIRADYFVSDLVVELKLLVLVVAQNRLACLNHTMLTVRSIAQHGLRCIGVALNDFSETPNIASATNPEILEKILDVPLLPGLAEDMTELPSDWKSMIASV